MADRASIISAVQYPPDSLRELVSAIFPQPGVVNQGDFQVTQHAGTPAMNVDVAAGYAVVKGVLSAVTEGSYPFLRDSLATYTVAAADPTNPRNDLVCAVVTDSAYAVDGTPNTQNVRVLTGTPSATPADPAIPGTWAAYLVLARVRVNANATSVVNANITDLRTFAQMLTPPGVIDTYAGSTAPAGWLLCDGTSYATATYPNLFAVVGYTFGGTGANFNVPDLRERFPLGAGATHTRGTTGGSFGTIATGGESAQHTHAIGFNTAVDNNSHAHSGVTTGGSNSGNQTVVHTHGVSGNTGVDGSGHTHTANDTTPFVTLNNIIKF